MKLYLNEIEDIEQFIYELQMKYVQGAPEQVPIPRAMLILMCEALRDWLKTAKPQ